MHLLNATELHTPRASSREVQRTWNAYHLNRDLGQSEKQSQNENNEREIEKKTEEQHNKSWRESNKYFGIIIITRLYSWISHIHSLHPPLWRTVPIGNPVSLPLHHRAFIIKLFFSGGCCWWWMPRKCKKKNFTAKQILVFTAGCCYSLSSSSLYGYFWLQCTVLHLSSALLLCCHSKSFIVVR